MATSTMQLSNLLVETIYCNSIYLNRNVTIDCYLPLNVEDPSTISLLLINDGQDLPTMPFQNILNDLLENNLIEPVICAGIYCGADRKMEYGTAGTPDYKGRGAKAGAYTAFVFEELLPLLHQTYNVPSFKEKSFAGFSLGGLSALDIVWNHAEQFANVGVFSGSLWWRSKGYMEGYNEDTDRIMHQEIRNGKYYPWLKFFFECGTLDEKADRNNNGVIDAIDDTLDVIKELHAKGYDQNAVNYLEINGGTHDVQTWAKAFPDFLKWAWGK